MRNKAGVLGEGGTHTVSITLGAIALVFFGIFFRKGGGSGFFFFFSEKPKANYMQNSYQKTCLINGFGTRIGG